MKFTESLFPFPAILYDEIEMIKRETSELEKEFNSPEGIMPYVIGVTKIPFHEIKSYAEYWTKGTSIDELLHNGCNCTEITTDTLGTYLCSWSLKQLENKLDIFQKKLQDYQETLIDKI